MLDVPNDLFWPAPWKPVPIPTEWLGKVSSVEGELRRELFRGHLLYGVTCKAVAWNSEDVNEFLFVTNETSIPIAFVHLTWQVEPDPEWPFTAVYSGWNEFLKAWNNNTSIE